MSNDSEKYGADKLAFATMTTTPIQLANAINEMAENPKGGKMAAIAYSHAAKLIRTKLVDPATDDARRADRLRDLLRRAISYGKIEPQLDQEIADALRVPCRFCGGTGFSGYGTGYDAVCGECGGQQFELDATPSPDTRVREALIEIKALVDEPYAATRNAISKRIDEILCAALPQPGAVEHASDCAVNNGPALPVGPCNCGAELVASGSPRRFRPVGLVSGQDTPSAALDAATVEAATKLQMLKDALGEIANRAANMGDPDAAEWLPSIYKIACVTIGIDPSQLLKDTGFDGDIKDWPIRALTGKDKA